MQETNKEVKELKEKIQSLKDEADEIYRTIFKLSVLMKSICQHDYKLTSTKKIPATYLEHAQVEYNYTCSHCGNVIQNYFYC